MCRPIAIPPELRQAGDAVVAPHPQRLAYAHTAVLVLTGRAAPLRITCLLSRCTSVGASVSDSALWAVATPSRVRQTYAGRLEPTGHLVSLRVHHHLRPDQRRRGVSGWPLAGPTRAVHVGDGDGARWLLCVVGQAGGARVRSTDAPAWSSAKTLCNGCAPSLLTVAAGRMVGEPMIASPIARGLYAAGTLHRAGKGTLLTDADRVPQLQCDAVVVCTAEDDHIHEMGTGDWPYPTIRASSRGTIRRRGRAVGAPRL